ncbi:MAG: SsrA-binding protein SmpB [Candidatus Omnitrophica bacterium]|nr:SsrA-binding protein SmpB [Candidatus Omnitrophota bacterium]
MAKRKDPKTESKTVRSPFEAVAENRKAHFHYFIRDRFEAGIALLGCEVKSIRERRVNLKDSYVRIVRDEAYLINCHISPYSKIQGYQEIDPTRMRKLLLKRSEINKLMGQTTRKGLTIVPLRMYFKKGMAKVEIAVGEGKKQYDKRAAIKQRIHTRESQAAVKRAMRK